MAGHSKWANIKHKKAAQDAKRGKVFTKIIKELMVAAKTGGSDPEANPRLRQAISTAKAANMPSDTISRNIQKGAGELEGVDYEELSYEGFGPEGVAIMIDVMTDNKNRTVAEIRHLMAKFGGNLGENGCVSYLFDRIGSIIYPANLNDFEKFLDYSIETDTKDIFESGEFYEIITNLESFNDIREKFSDQFGEPDEANIIWKSKEHVDLNENSIHKIFKLINGLDDCEDVQNVFYNFEFDEKSLQILEE